MEEKQTRGQLTHVSIRDKELGWKHISVREAEEKYPNQSVSSNDRVFMCELCGQYVTFACGQILGTRYFRHSRGEEDKTCEERTQSDRQYPHVPAGKCELPIRIRLTKESVATKSVSLAQATQFSLSLGIPPFEEFTSDTRFVVQGNEDHPHIFKTETDKKGIQWFSLGQDVAIRYRFLPENVDTKVWPEVVPGINPAGALFEGKSRRMIPYDGLVTVGKRYLLLVNKKQSPCKDVDCDLALRTSINGKTWYLYQVMAKDFSSDSVRFFLLLKTHLVKRPVDLQILWPPTVNVRGTRYYSGDRLFVGNDGDDTQALLVMPSGTGKIVTSRGDYCIFANGFQQMAAVHYDNGQTLKSSHVMIWHKEPNLQVPDYTLQVWFISGEGKTIAAGDCPDIPASGNIIVHSRFDGQIVFSKDGNVCNTMPIFGGEAKTVPVDYGITITVRQGCDTAASVTFPTAAVVQPVTVVKPSETETLLKLLSSSTAKSVTIGHEFGAVLKKLPDDPRLKAQIRQCIKAGKIPATAYRAICAQLNQQ